MAEYHHPLEGEPSVFVRWRNGSRLNIPPNPRERIREILPKLRENPDHKKVFHETIKDILDGSGAGIHPDSTWHAAVEEIFNKFERYSSQPISQEAKDALLETLEIIVQGESVAEDWETIRTAILDRLDLLTAWKYSFRSEDKLTMSIQRDADGSYFYIDDQERRVEVIGAKTASEEHFQYVSNDTMAGFGHVRGILGLVALLDIAEQYTSNPTHFSDRVVCSLPDSEHETHSLEFSWYTLGGWDYLPAFWKPRSCFSDPEWLAFDLLANLPEATEAHHGYAPKLDMEDPTALQLFQEASSGYPMQYEVALETNLLLGNQPEVYIDFEDRKLRWINGTRFLYPILIVPCRDDDGSDGSAIAKRFLSALSKDVDHVILAEAWGTVNGASFFPLIRHPRAMAGFGIDPRYILANEDPATFSGKRWVALALYREAQNSRSLYYEFLSYYKILELAWDGDERKTRDWINSNIDDACAQINSEWKSKVLDPTRQQAYARLYGTDRTAIAHIGAGGDNSRRIENPDDPADYTKMRDDLPIVKSLVKLAFKQGLLN